MTNKTERMTTEEIRAKAHAAAHWLMENHHEFSILNVSEGRPEGRWYVRERDNSIAQPLYLTHEAFVAFVEKVKE